MDRLALNAIVNPLLELRLVALLVVVGQGLHVLGNVATEDVPTHHLSYCSSNLYMKERIANSLPQGLSIELLALNVESREPAFAVGDEEATVAGTLHGTEDTRTSRSPVQANIEVGLERTAGLAVDLGRLGQLVLAIDLLNALEGLSKAQLGERATS